MIDALWIAAMVLVLCTWITWGAKLIGPRVVSVRSRWLPALRLLERAGIVAELPRPALPPPLVLGPLATRAHLELVNQAQAEPLRCLAAQGGLFRARMGGQA